MNTKTKIFLMCVSLSSLMVLYSAPDKPKDQYIKIPVIRGLNDDLIQKEENRNDNFYRNLTTVLKKPKTKKRSPIRTKKKD